MLKIFIFLLLTGVVANSVSDFWLKTETSVVKLEEKEKDNKKESETEKEEYKDKLFQNISFFQNENSKQALFVLHHVYFKSPAFFSLPEIPPELA